MPRQALALLKERHRRSKDRGAVAVFVALTMVVIVAGAAFAVDSASIALARQDLQDTLDSSAQIGASILPNQPGQAVTDATTYLASVDPDAVPTVSLWCVVGSSGTDLLVLEAQIPATCDPGVPGPFVDGTGGVVCDELRCAIPADPSSAPGAVPNTISIQTRLPVVLYFAPAVGIATSTTGLLSSTSCRGICGATTDPGTTTKYIQLPV